MLPPDVPELPKSPPVLGWLLVVAEEPKSPVVDLEKRPVAVLLLLKMLDELLNNPVLPLENSPLPLEGVGWLN